MLYVYDLETSIAFMDKFVRKGKKMKGQIGVITGKIVAGLIIGILVSFAFLSAVCPSARANSTWDKTYGGAESDTAAGETVQASDGGYAILGDTSSLGAGGSDFWLIKTDADGNMQWNKTYGGTGTEKSGDMCLTSDGGYAMSGYTTSIGAGGQDFWLVKTDAAGNMLWNMTYGGTGNEYAYHVEQTLDGGYALLGQTSSLGAGGNDFWLVKTDASGNMQWNQTYGGPGNDIGIHVLQTVEGGYALAGSTSSFGAGSNDAWLIKTDAAGNMQWNKTYGGTGMEFGQCLEPTSDGGYAIACITTSFGAGSLDSWLIKLDSSGNIEWNMTYGGPESDAPTHFIQTEDEGYAIVGFTTVGSDQNASLIKTDAFGNMEWNQTYGGTGTEIAYALLKTNDGYYLLTINTNSFGAGNNDIWLVSVVPEGLTIGVMLLLSTVAAIVGIRILRKRPK
jgi:predicted secreted protein